MKIILTSKAFGDGIATNSILNQLDKNISSLKVLLLATPCLPYGPEKYLNELISNGFNKENIIIFNHEKANDFSNLDIDIIYVTGGNTFTGLKLIKESSFDKALRDYINRGVIYIGRSAGSHIATKNVEHVLQFDSNEIGLTNFEGLGLLDAIIVCHYSEERKSCYDKLISENKYNVFSLTNQEILVYDGIKIEKISPSEEFKEEVNINKK